LFLNIHEMLPSVTRSYLNVSPSCQDKEIITYLATISAAVAKSFGSLAANCTISGLSPWEKRRRKKRL
jgi:hypothetical protein